jgi:hypothetical protein
MLINVYRDRPAAIPGTRLLESTLGIVGRRLPDTHNMARVWEVHGVYMPVSGRALGGIRVKLADQKGFVTFCNQRDLEVMLGMGAPGGYCPWSGTEYVGPDYEDWCGFCCDDDDLLDDLYEREAFTRAQVPGGVLGPGYEITRRVHLGKNSDCEELHVMTGDMDLDTGFFPDTRFETIARRWVRAERSRVRWEQT